MEVRLAGLDRSEPYHVRGWGNLIRHQTKGSEEAMVGVICRDLLLKIQDRILGDGKVKVVVVVMVVHVSNRAELDRVRVYLTQLVQAAFGLSGAAPTTSLAPPLSPAFGIPDGLQAYDGRLGFNLLFDTYFKNLSYSLPGLSNS